MAKKKKRVREQLFTVVYEIQVSASSPEEALEKVVPIIEETAYRSFYTIKDEEGNETKIDLLLKEQ